MASSRAHVGPPAKPRRRSTRSSASTGFPPSSAKPAARSRSPASPGFTILRSVELDILENGKLDLPDDVLADADYVVATIHYGLNQGEKELIRRLVGAAEHPWVDAI